MIYFSDRRKLAELFEKYCKEHENEKIKIPRCPFNVVGWLYGLGLLNEEKVKEVLRNE